MEEASTRALALEAHMEAAQARAAELQQGQVGGGWDQHEGFMRLTCKCGVEPSTCCT
jgi:hypothetical protein